MGLRDKAKKLRDEKTKTPTAKADKPRKELNEQSFLSVMPEFGRITLQETVDKLGCPPAEIKKVAKELDKKQLIKIQKHIRGETEFWVTRKLYDSRQEKPKKEKEKAEELGKPAENGRIETDETKIRLRDIVPSEGSLRLRDACSQLGIDNTQGKKLAKALYNDGYVRVRLHFMGGRELLATKKLVTYRKDLEDYDKAKADERRRDEIASVDRINTQLDEIIRVLNNRGNATVSQVSELLKIEPDMILSFARIMPKLVDVEYPANILASPVLKIKKKLVSAESPFPAGEMLDSYTVNADNVPAKIFMIDTPEDSMPLYVMRIPTPGPGTREAVRFLSDKLSDEITIQSEEITDPKRMAELRKKFGDISTKLVENYIPAGQDEKKILAGMLLHRTFGLGYVELMMNDDWLEEVCVNTSHTPLTAYHKKFGWSMTNMFLEDENMIYNYASQIGRKIGKGISNLDPIMDAHLLTGDRVNATLFPISSLGNTITIRKFARQPWTITHFISPEYLTLSKEIAAFLWLCLQYELNIIVGGGTASGKTSVLNCLLSLIQPTHRIITIEDTREINLPKFLYWNWIPLTTRDPNPEGKGEVSMLDLIVTSLRMRPDRVVLGEVRRRNEAEVMFEAMHTGHSVYGTMHADTSRNLKRRLLEPPIELPAQEVEALHLILIQYRDRTTGKRKTFEVAEIVPGTESKEFDLNYLYRWNPRTQSFSKINESQRVYNELNLHTGMDKDEIEKDLKEKEEVLQWMLDKRIDTIDEVGRVMDRYYKNKNRLLDIVRAKKDLE
ncbi:MAG: type II/IV secretion system ATPase subunit [Candidatus Altiarchaeota archaeon]